MRTIRLANALILCCIVALLSSCGSAGKETSAEPDSRPRSDAEFQAKIDEKLNSEHDPAIHFRGTVKSIEMGRAEGPGVINVGFDRRWVIVIDVKSVTEENPYVKPDKTAYFNVHSPTRVLGLWDDKTPGQTFDFELISRKLLDGGLGFWWLRGEPPAEDEHINRKPAPKS